MNDYFVFDFLAFGYLWFFRLPWTFKLKNIGLNNIDKRHILT